MTDVLTPQQRKLNMSRITAKNTNPEMLVRRGLHARGLRYRLHHQALPGRPDLIFPRYRAAVFVHGCFWHAHGCSLSKLPTTRREFWQAKLAANAARDQRVLGALQANGWRVLVVWECALIGPRRHDKRALLDRVASFITSCDSDLLEISGGEIRDAM